MDDALSVADLSQLFSNTVILYKNRPTKVVTISQDKTFKMVDLLTQKVSNVINPVKDIQPPLRRLGMINVAGGCVYARRVPRRIYTIGFNSANVKLDSLNHFSYEQADSREKLRNFDTVELGECMFGIYPTFKEAVKEIRQFAGTTAFDRQFAIDTDDTIWYRNIKVGRYSQPARKVSLEYVVWKPEYEYLANIIGETNEKDLRVHKDTEAHEG